MGGGLIFEDKFAGEGEVGESDEPDDCHCGGGFDEEFMTEAGAVEGHGFGDGQKDGKLPSGPCVENPMAFIGIVDDEGAAKEGEHHPCAHAAYAHVKEMF